MLDRIKPRAVAPALLSLLGATVLAGPAAAAAPAAWAAPAAVGAAAASGSTVGGSQLASRGVVVSWREDKVRAMFHAYNDGADIDALAEGLVANRDLLA